MRKAIKKVGIKTHFEYILNKFPHFVLTLLPINIVNQVRSGTSSFHYIFNFLVYYSTSECDCKEKHSFIYWFLK